MEVYMPYDTSWGPLYWAKKNCPSYITNSATPDGQIVYYFGNKKDVMLFILRWK